MSFGWFCRPLHTIQNPAHEQAREFAAALAKSRQSGNSSEIQMALRKLQRAAAEAIAAMAAPVPGGDKQRPLARIGAASVVEDLLPIGSVLHAREALETF